jgi:hypothetical protein
MTATRTSKRRGGCVKAKSYLLADRRGITAGPVGALRELTLGGFGSDVIGGAGGQANYISTTGTAPDGVGLVPQEPATQSAPTQTCSAYLASVGLFCWSITNFSLS